MRKKKREFEAWARLNETQNDQADEPNPSRMFFFGAVSLFAALAITPNVACGLYPLVTSAEFGERIPADAAGAFVFVSTMFVAFYKLTNEFWRWQLRRGKTRKTNYKAMAGYLFFLLGLVAIIVEAVPCVDGPNGEKAESVEETEEDGGRL
ncbi:MAG: hypothetical protein OXI18_02545 [bacterium]|nr:hypothetical protein [bacterium]